VFLPSHGLGEVQRAADRIGVVRAGRLKPPPRPSGRRPRTSRGTAVRAVVAVLAYIVNGLGPQIPWLEPFQTFSPFYQCAGHGPLVQGLSVSAVVVAVGTVAVLAVIGFAGFQRRDIAA